MRRLRGLVMGPHPQWPDRLQLHGEDGLNYVVMRERQHWPQRPPMQCLTAGSPVIFLVPSERGYEPQADLRLPEHHPDWQILRGLRRGQVVQVLLGAWDQDGRLQSAPELVVEMYSGVLRFQPLYARRRVMRARITGFRGAAIQARICSGPRNWGLVARWRARRIG